LNRTDLIMCLLNIPLIGRTRAKNIIRSYLHGTDLRGLIAKLYPFLSLSDSDFKRAWYKTLLQKSLAEERGIRIVSSFDSLYPRNFSSLKDYPPVLFLKGNSAILNRPGAAALVGSRQIGRKVMKLTEQIGEQLFIHGVTVVSGLALGCDTIAHKTALKNGGLTVAVLPCGPDIIYPDDNSPLYYQILENNGMILSEYVPGVYPAPFRFVERDRLQSGLSDFVILMESGQKGGSMHTANRAISQNRPLLVYQPDSFSVKTSGNRLLIKEEKVYPFRSLEDFIILMKNIPGIIRDCNRESDQLIFPYV